MRQRQQVIRDFIVAELMKQGLSIKDLAHKLGKSSGSVQQVVRGWTSTPVIKNEIIRILGKDPWKLYPPQDYQFGNSDFNNSTT